MKKMYVCAQKHNFGLINIIYTQIVWKSYTIKFVMQLSTDILSLPALDFLRNTLQTSENEVCQIHIELKSRHFYM